MVGPALSWQVRRFAVCASTERQLERWLRSRERERRPLPGALAGGLAGGPAGGLAVVAAHQRFGQGQRGRPWNSPVGGLWLSAAMPWPTALADSASLSLAVAVGLALQLEALGALVQLKWPNDVLVGGRKLAGILPRLRLRGAQVRWAQVGLGLNGINHPPSGAVSLAQALSQGLARAPSCLPHRPFHPKAKPQRLLKPVLAALDWAQAMANEPELVRQQAEARLHRPAEGLLHGGQIWQVAGLEPDGGLRLQRPGATFILQRSF